jgi:hypothetical protein
VVDVSQNSRKRSRVVDGAWSSAMSFPPENIGRASDDEMTSTEMFRSDSARRRAARRDFHKSKFNVFAGGQPSDMCATPDVDLRRTSPSRACTFSLATIAGPDGLNCNAPHAKRI